MMPGVGFAEMIILVLVSIVVIGPKDLPLMMRKFGRFTGKMRALAFEFKQGIDELGRQAELDELRKEVADLKKHTGLEELEREMQEDANRLERDVNTEMAEPAQPKIAPPTSGPGAIAAATAEAPKPIPNYAGLSADHPGYDAGDDFRIDGPPLENGHAQPATDEAAEEPAAPPAAEPAKPEPVKQDTPA
ncbi:MAG: Sec-independent protein translocase protein TatB [Hyphomonadaceae bacterium]|nr:Sec-independent protein translocase protein TatB [Hyphomonadaceae bacterium]